jgi:hypothetical protein
VKLSKAAATLLGRLEHDELPCHPRRNRAAMELRHADYAEWNDQAGNGLWWLRITPAGRAALEERS